MNSSILDYVTSFVARLIHYVNQPKVNFEGYLQVFFSIHWHFVQTVCHLEILIEWNLTTFYKRSEVPGNGIN